jgi:hypothetical protein
MGKVNMQVVERIEATLRDVKSEVEAGTMDATLAKALIFLLEDIKGLHGWCDGEVLLGKVQVATGTLPLELTFCCFVIIVVAAD